MLCVTKVYFGITYESLCAETTRAYGYSRVGEKISLAMENAYQHLIKSGKIKVVENKVVVQ